MKRIALIIALIGMFVLLGLMFYGFVREINNMEDVESLEDNQKVVISGNVIEQKGGAIILDNGVKAECEGCLNYHGKNVSILGVVDKYDNKKSIFVLRIGVLE
ncbi:MAG: hypothetical protein AABX73_04300 [Nanoarchaeota archaeon]